MTTINETEITLSENLEEGLPLFSGIDSGLIEGFLPALLDSSPLILKDGRISRDENSVIVNGNALFLGVSTEIEGTFTELDGSPVVSLAAKLSDEMASNVPGLPDISVQNLSLTLDNRKIPAESESLDFLSISLSGTLQLEEISLPIAITLPDADQEYWLIEGDFEDVELPDVTQLAKLSGMEDLSSRLPEELIQAGNLVISDVKIAFDPRKPAIYFVLINLKLSPQIDLIPDMIALSDAGIYLRLFHATDDIPGSVTGSVIGKLLLGGTTFEISSALHDLNFSGSLAEGSTINLSTLAREILPPEISLPQNITDVVLSDLRIQADLEARSLSIYGRSYLDWQMVPGLVHLDAVEINLQHLTDASEGTVNGIFVVAGESVEVNGDLGSELSVHGRISEISLSSIANNLLAGVSLPSDLPDFSFSDVHVDIMPQEGAFSINGTSSDVWEIPLGVSGAGINNIHLNLNASKGDDGKQVISGNISGVLKIGTASIEIAYNLPGDFVLTGDMPVISLSLLLQEFCGGDVVRALPLPVSILEIELTSATFTIAPQQKQLSFAGVTPLGQAEIVINQAADGAWGFNIGFVPPDNWNFSTIDPALAVLDNLNFNDSSLIVSSSGDSSLALNTIKLPHGDGGVQKGVNFFANLDISALGIKEMLPGFEVDTLQVFAAIGNRTQDLIIESAIAGVFQIDNTTSFGDITFRLRPSPTDFAISLFGTVTTTIDDSPLIFIGGLGVTAPPPAGALEATMVGTWDNPFGTQNLSISNVALDLEIPPALIPSIGIAGDLSVGDFVGTVAVKLNTAQPANSMLAVEFNELTLVDLFDAFCPLSVRQAIPRDLATTVLDVTFENVNIYVVPQATTIGNRAFEQGISLQGRMIFWGLGVDGVLRIDQNAGVEVLGDIDNIVLGSMFKLTGAAGKPKASLYADLRLGHSSSIDISGAVEFLGMSREVEISISDAGFTFTTSGKIFDRFESTLVVRGSDMVNGDGIIINAAMKNDLFDFLSAKTSEAIKVAAEEALREIEDAQRAVSRVQEDVDKLNASITSMRRTIQSERDRDTKRLRDAQGAVQKEQNKVNSLNQQILNMRNSIQRERDRDTANLGRARQTVQSQQNKVNSLNRDITNVRNTVRAERDRDTSNLRTAQRTVTNAQNEVNKIQRDINGTKNRIAEINKLIAAKKRWLDSQPWYHKVWAGPEYAAYESAKRAEQAALYTKLAGMEAAKHTALGVLEAAKRSLRSMESAIKTFPIDADPRVSALITARETATAALNAAKGTLRSLENAAKTFPIDADPRMVGLFAARNSASGALGAAKLALKGIEVAIKAFPIDADPRMISLFSARDTASGALQVAKFTLEGVEQSVKGMAKVSQFIAENANKFLVINEALFETSLSAVHGGSVSLAVKLTFMDEPHDLAFDFNFHDPLRSAQTLADSLLSA